MVCCCFMCLFLSLFCSVSQTASDLQFLNSQHQLPLGYGRDLYIVVAFPVEIHLVTKELNSSCLVHIFSSAHQNEIAGIPKVHDYPQSISFLSSAFPQ